MDFNSKKFCLVCFGKFTGDNPRIKHHISYYPEIIGHVHYKCHQKIHDPDNPLMTYIQYDRSDSIRYYQEKKKEGDSDE